MKGTEEKKMEQALKKMNEILTALTHIGTVEGRMCREMLEKGEVGVEDVLLHLAGHTNILRSQRVIDHNKLIHDSIKNLIIMGCWPQLSQIFKSMPDEIDRAVKESRAQIDVSLIMNLYTKQVGRFIHMSEKERTLLLEIHDGVKHEEEEKECPHQPSYCAVGQECPEEACVLGKLRKMIICNRTACSKEVSIQNSFWNRSTLALYCRECATILNQENPPTDSFPHILCISYQEACMKGEMG